MYPEIKTKEQTISQCPFSVYPLMCDSSCEDCNIREEFERKANEDAGARVRAFWNEYPDRA